MVHRINISSLNKFLLKKGVVNVEVTHKGKDYYVLHILRNGVPVPLFKTQNKIDLNRYVKNQYGREDIQEKP